MRLIVAALLATLAACSPSDVEHAVEAAFVAIDIASGRGPSLYKSWKNAPEAVEIDYKIEDRGYQATLYLPATTRAGLVVVPGLHPDGHREPNLVALATTLARAGFAVLIPDLPNYRRLQIGAQDPVGIADALRHLRQRPEGAGKLGIAGISYASGPAFLAALEPDLADRVGFVFALGGYYDIDSVLTYLVTARHREGPDQPWQRGQPNDYGSWHFIRANASRLAEAKDRETLRQIAERRMADLGAPYDDLLAGAGPDAQAVMRLLSEPDPDKVPARIRELPEILRGDFEALTLAGKPLERFKARAILLHGRDDRIVPYTESLRLARVLGQDRVELHLVRSLAHVDFDPKGIADFVEIWQAGRALLRERR